VKQHGKTDPANQTAASAETEAMPGAAGFWRRLAGFVVDTLLCFGIPSVVSSLALLAVGYSSRSAVVDALWMFFLAAVVVAYFTIFALRGASPGMRLAGIKLVDIRSGRPPGLSQSFIRASLLMLLIGSWFILVLLSSSRGSGLSNAGAILLNVAYVLFLTSFFGHLWIAWDRKRQTLQDKAAGLLVVRRNAVIEPVERPARNIDPLEWRM
jgi:uncharacterized RDD family membrane protein YckC